MLARPSDLDGLMSWENLLGKESLRVIRSATKTQQPFIYGAARSPRASLYVLVARDRTGLDTLVERLATRTSIDKLEVGGDAR